MKKAENIKQGNQNIKILTESNQEYDSIQRDILKEKPTPSVEAAYGWVKTEAARLRIMPPASLSSIGEANGSNADTSFGGEIGHGFTATGQGPATQNQRPPYRGAPPRLSATSRSGNQQKSRAGAEKAKLTMGVNTDGSPSRIDGGNHGESGGPGTGVRQENQTVGGNVRGAVDFAERKGNLHETAQ